MRVCVVPSVRGPCEHDRDYTVACFFVKLSRHVKHDKRMNPIDFGGQRSKVKVTMDIYRNKLVNSIETKPFCISLSNLVDMLTMVSYPRATRCGGDIVTLLWFRPSVCPCVRVCVVPSVRGPCEHDRDYTVACFFVKLSRHVKHDKRMNPIDFGGQRSKVKVTMDIYRNKLVNTIETKPFCISLSNLVDMLTMVRE